MSFALKFLVSCFWELFDTIIFYISHVYHFALFLVPKWNYVF